MTRAGMLHWQAGDMLLLSGRILTGRDAAHKRIVDLLARGEALPPGVDFNARFIYYVGPVDPVRDEVVGPAGPTTATRMDKFTEIMLERTGLLGMIGKGERGPTAVEAIRRHGAVSLVAVGGAAYLVSKAIRSSRLVAFPELGHGGDLRVRGGEHAGDRRGGRGRLLGAQDGSRPVAPTARAALRAHRLSPVESRGLSERAPPRCSMQPIARSFLFVPGNRPDLYEKAYASRAHEVIVDLEDAVGPGDKGGAREGRRRVARFLPPGAAADQRRQAPSGFRKTSRSPAFQGFRRWSSPRSRPSRRCAASGNRPDRKCLSFR